MGGAELPLSRIKADVITLLDTVQGVHNHDVLVDQVYFSKATKCE